MTNTELIEQILQENTDTKTYISVYLSSKNKNQIPNAVFEYAVTNFDKVYFDDSFLTTEVDEKNIPVYHTEITIVDTDAVLYEKINALLEYLLQLQSQLSQKTYIKFNGKMYSTRLAS